MSATTVTCLDSFPKYFKTNILMYYTVRSTRVTVVSLGMCQIMLYADMKQMKTFLLPEEILCGTIINVPMKSQGSMGNGKVLICGSSKGSIFILPLPTNKEMISILKKRNRAADTGGETSLKSDFACAFKYSGLSIKSVSCYDGNLLVLGKDELSDCRLFIFQASVLYEALKTIDCLMEQPSHVSSHPYETVVIEPPSISASKDPEPNFILFQGDHSQSSPFYTSLDTIQYLEKRLFESLFVKDLVTLTTPVACFFYKNGEVWFLPLSSEYNAKRKLLRLIHLHDTCVAVAAALLAPDFSKESDEKSGTDSAQPGLMLLGKDTGIYFLSSHSNVGAVPDQIFKTVHVPYSNDLKSFSSGSNKLISCSQAFMWTMQKSVPGVNVTANATNFLCEQQVGLKKSDRIWTLQEYEDENRLLAVDVCKMLSEHSFLPTSRPEISELLANLNTLSMKSANLEKQSKNMTTCLMNLSKLASYLTDKECGGPLLKFDVSHALVACSDASRLCITVKVHDTDLTSLLSTFSFDLHVAVKHGNEAIGETHNFSMHERGKAEPLCVMVDKEMFEGIGTVKLFIFVCLLGLKNVSAEVKEMLSPGFPLLIPTYSDEIKVF